MALKPLRWNFFRKVSSAACSAIFATFASASCHASSVVSRTSVVIRSPNSSGGRSRSRLCSSPFSRAIRSATPSSGSPQNSCTSDSVADTRSAGSEAPPK